METQNTRIDAHHISAEVNMGDGRRPETLETRVAWLITQRPMACPIRRSTS
jgi:hypothetical protein